MQILREKARFSPVNRHKPWAFLEASKSESSYVKKRAQSRSPGSLPVNMNGTALILASICPNLVGDAPK